MPKSSSQHKETLIEWWASFCHFFILLLVFKTYAVQMFSIPTGSMAETLMGAHAKHACPNCGISYLVGFQSDPWQILHNPNVGITPSILQCPNCRYLEWRQDEVRENTRATFGDRIAVFGWPYELGWAGYEPQRWDVIVFRNPENPMENFIKRLVAKPGEEVEVINGDVFIDGVIQTKPRATQETLWALVYDHDYPPHAAGGSNDLPMRPMWVRVKDGQAQQLPRSFTIDAREGAPQEVVFMNGANQTGGPYPIIDDLGYNVPQSVTSNPQASPIPDAVPRIVTDTRLQCQITPLETTGQIELRTSKYEHAFYAVADLEADELRLEYRDPETQQRTVWQTLGDAGLDRPFQLALANADYRVTIELNGRSVLASTAEQFTTTPEAARARFRQPVIPEIQIAVDGARVTLAHLRIDRDIFYRSYEDRRPDLPMRGVQERAFQLKADEYFVLGDNSTASQDSRFWQNAGPHTGNHDYRPGTVPADQIMGRAFFVYWPGFLPLFGKGVPIVPNLGDIRFIY